VKTVKDVAVKNDLDSYWMPFTGNRRFKANPRLIVEASGMYYRKHDGGQLLDATAGLWCSNVGHGNARIIEAVQRQVATLDYAPAFQVSHPDAFTLASRIGAMAPGDLNHVFFCNSGSEAVDTALKVALAYHRARGDGARTRFIGRERGYHGVGFGGLSVGGMVANRKAFSGAMLPGVDHLRHTHDPLRNAFSRGQPQHGAELADDLERLVALHDASTIAAVIVEPVACSTGVLVPPIGYLERLRAICDRYNLLLIFDEVITAFGRLGTSFGADYFGVKPDMITTAKGLTSGVVPMGAVIVSDDIYDGVVTSAPEGAIELFHGYTYSAHPLACAAALATLDVYRQEELFERVAALAPSWEDRLHGLRGVPHVADLRNIGLIGAIELEPWEGRPGSKGFEVFKRCWDRGVLIRVTGDVIALSPPYIVQANEIDLIFDTLAAVLNEI
jgi:beta-alanine--pyruvate transaminase